VIGYLDGTTPEANVPQLAAFCEGLSETGWFEGQNLAIGYRWAEFCYERLPHWPPLSSAEGSISSQHVVVPVRHSQRKARPRRPRSSLRPVPTRSGPGYLPSLARPGGNLTGGVIHSVELRRKRVELISELVPQAKAIGCLMNPKNSAIEPNIASAREAAGAAWPTG